MPVDEAEAVIYLINTRVYYLDGWLSVSALLWFERDGRSTPARLSNHCDKVYPFTANKRAQALLVDKAEIAVFNYVDHRRCYRLCMRIGQQRRSSKKPFLNSCSEYSINPVPYS
jgi:hypothetical protein